jgi:hypothetical protein
MRLTEHHTPIPQVTIPRIKFIKQIEPFKAFKPKFHEQLLQVFDNGSRLSILNLKYNQI